ncbi:uncharacterized protein LOC122829103 isoform X1 [Gambusia affinis]|uniref:uncharacterized protein LOC122829103 isoform X1 n=1 Tax=Gambusia affinis TaxID=33528 RepID=UPI001CDD7B0F|nr:uncharacterized protein LOC122829103 isoform X1 [Gambusia affinis]
MRDKSWNNLDPLREYRDKCHSLVSNLDVWQCNKVTISLPPPQPFHQPQLLFISETGGAGRPGASCRWSLKKRMSGFSPTGHDVCSRMTERSGSQHCCEYLDPPLPSVPPSLLFSTLHLPPPAASPAPPCWPVMRLANQFGSLIFAQQTGEASAGSRAEEAAFLSQPPLIIFRFISWPLPLVSVSERTCADSYLNVLMLSKWLVMCK